MSTFNVGDKVRVTGDSEKWHHGIDAGETVTVIRTSPRSLYTGADGCVVRASDGCDWGVADVDLEPITSDAETESASDPVLVDPARLQALSIAREALGSGATLADLLTLSTFVLGTPAVEAVPVDEPAKVDTSVTLEITDHDGDSLRVERATNRVTDIAFVSTDNDGVYLTAADIDRVVAYLLALKG
jgi:hypothetical protein